MSDYEKIIDVAIFTNGPLISTDEATIEKYPPIRNEFEITDDLAIKRLNYGLSQKILDACEPKEYNFCPPRQFAELYTIVRKNPPPEDDKKYEWDPDQKIQYCILLSRLIHPTTISFEYAARVYLKNNDEAFQIVRGPYQGLGTIAYLADKNRDWLTLDDVIELKALFEAFIKTTLGKEISRAIWHFEYAARIIELEVRWALLITGIESLIHTWGENQFAKRLPRICHYIGLDEIDFNKAKKMYKFRSSYVHGKGIFKNEISEMNELYCKMEYILRNIIKTAINDPELASILSNPKKVRKKWPI